jgi:hypothetical protein
MGSVTQLEIETNTEVSGMPARTATDFFNSTTIAQGVI